MLNNLKSFFSKKSELKNLSFRYWSDCESHARKWGQRQTPLSNGWSAGQNTVLMVASCYDFAARAAFSAPGVERPQENRPRRMFREGLLWARHCCGSSWRLDTGPDEFSIWPSTATAVLLHSCTELLSGRSAHWAASFLPPRVTSRALICLKTGA